MKLNLHIYYAPIQPFKIKDIKEQYRTLYLKNCQLHLGAGLRAPYKEG